MSKELQKRINNGDKFISASVLANMDDLSHLSEFPMFTPIIKDFSKPELIDRSLYHKYGKLGLIFGFPIIIIDSGDIFSAGFGLIFTIYSTLVTPLYFVDYLFDERGWLSFTFYILASLSIISLMSLSAMIYLRSKEDSHLLINLSSESYNLLSFLDNAARYLTSSDDKGISDILQNPEYLEKLNLMYSNLPDNWEKSGFVERQCRIIKLGEKLNDEIEWDAVQKERRILREQLSDISAILQKSLVESEHQDKVVLMSNKEIENKTLEELKSINNRLRDFQYQYWSNRQRLSADFIASEVSSFLRE